MKTGSSPVRRIKLIIAYDGTNYYGFQSQPDGNTIQDVLEKALSQIADHPVKVTAAGRTDSGVHAAGQVVHWDLQGSIPTPRIVPALQGLLPPDIVVYQAEEVADDFHARFQAKSKIYRYSILASSYGWPFISRYVLHHPYELDLQALRWAGRLLQGKKDFAAFQAAGATTHTTVRNLMRVETNEQAMEWGKVVHITFEADGFLYHMVRNLVGTMLEVGQGRQSLDWLEKVVASGDRRQAGPTAPARGLILDEVKY